MVIKCQHAWKIFSSINRHDTYGGRVNGMGDGRRRGALCTSVDGISREIEALLVSEVHAVPADSLPSASGVLFPNWGKGDRKSVV